ncbi:hypothetical protein [Mycobacterium sp.]|uniref:hypothetical protein n=1 Tax=Mycobacterium sp. TaxID=1785 RepID=UPI003BB08160
MSTNEMAPVTNLPAARKEQAAARKETAATKTRHPAGKAPAKTPAKKAPAKPKVASTKITWTNDGEKDAKGQAPGTGVCGDRTYNITGSGENWKCTVQIGKAKPEVLGENLKSGGAAWRKCVDHNKGRAAA